MVGCVFRNSFLSFGFLIFTAQLTYGNIYLSGEYANDVNAFLADQAHINQIDMLSNPFLSHAISSRAAGFRGPQYLPPVEKPQLICNGQEVCVKKNQCAGGSFTQQNLVSSRQDCDNDAEVCCTYRPSAQPTKPPIQSTPCTGGNYDCVSPNLCSNGQITQTGYVKHQATDKCYAPEVCCKIPDSTILTEDGYVVRTPEKPFPQPQPLPRPQPTPSRTQGQPRQPIEQPPSIPSRPASQPTKPRQPITGTLPTPSRPVPGSPSQPRQPVSALEPTPSRPGPHSQPAQPRQTIPRPQIQTDRGYLPPIQSGQLPSREQGQPPLRQPGSQPSLQVTYQPSQLTYQQPQLPSPPPGQALRQPVQTPRQPTSGYIPPRSPAGPTTGEGILSLPILPSKKPGQPVRPVLSNDIPESQLPTKCAAALNCTRSEYCSATGVISDTPVVLSEDQEIYRVPMTSCYNPEEGFNGVCCRDPNYKDPWPASQLGQYKAELFGDTGAYKPSTRTQRRANNNLATEAQSASNHSRRQAPNSRVARCASRNFNSVLQGDTSIDAAFGEYPWQAMILLESKKSLICGGVIIADDMVATSARCVQGRKPFDVIIKGGEWKLGSDIEPITFQNSRVKRIEIHPNYDSVKFNNDIALLHLDSKLKFDIHIAPLCIDDSDPDENEECYVTGWGKEVLKVHLQDAIMHHSKVTVLDRQNCNASADQLCGRPVLNACDLDYGSALACSNGSGNWVMKGIYSSENQCGDQSIITFTKPDSIFMNPSFKNEKAFATNFLPVNRY
ncbi:inactive serine protease scarface isoform X2 [Condylostylus longicornis]|nr:inactive serine protease scarface isoform X2 [Condylostylus longicornis]XP_055387831.1 inactive serine protease scarface isoform X2 [Condylostylus longicornis]